MQLIYTHTKFGRLVARTHTHTSTRMPMSIERYKCGSGSSSNNSKQFMCDRLYIIIHSFHFCKFNQLFGRWIYHLFLCAKVFETNFFFSVRRERVYIRIRKCIWKKKIFCSFAYLLACYRIQSGFFSLCFFFVALCSFFVLLFLRVFSVSLRKVVEALSMTAWLIQFYLFVHFFFLCLADWQSSGGGIHIRCGDWKLFVFLLVK